MPKSKSKKSSKKTSAPYAAEDKADAMYVSFLIHYTLFVSYKIFRSIVERFSRSILASQLHILKQTHTHKYTHTQTRTGSRPQRETPELEEEFVQRKISPDSYAGLVT